MLLPAALLPFPEKAAASRDTSGRVRAKSLMSMAHPLNWYLGWWLILSAFATGGLLGLFFEHEGFLGGYGTFRRRIIRLGHIALAALGMLNVLYGLSPWPVSSDWNAEAASLCFMAGGVAMPAVCFLTGWKRVFRFLFFIPVSFLVLAVLLTLRGAAS
jgi:hypothetical protein